MANISVTSECSFDFAQDGVCGKNIHIIGVVPAVPYHITQWGNFLQTFGFTKERENLTLRLLCALCGY